MAKYKPFVNYLVGGDLQLISEGGGGSSLIPGNGITINADVISVDILPNGGLKFVGGQLAVEVDDFAGEGLIDDGSDNLAINFATDFTIDAADSLAFKASDIANTTTGFGASIVGVEDVNGYFESNNVEGTLSELYKFLPQRIIGSTDVCVIPFVKIWVMTELDIEAGGVLDVEGELTLV
jgi:hypothetical protein